jgi:hypothetical protein
MAQTASPVKLAASTVEAFDAYIRTAETGMEPAPPGSEPLLWTQENPERAKEVREGQILAQTWPGEAPVKAPSGLIHDWIGAVFVAGGTVAGALGVVQDYDNHKKIYQPEVIDSRLIRREGDDFQIHLRLLKKKIVSVVLDTDHDVHYTLVGAMHWLCRSRTTRVCEVEDAGKPKEKILPPDAGYGFLWRLYSYWQFQEKDGGVYVECRCISLTRDVPKGLGWIIEPIIKKLPKESLIATLRATRQALARS